MKKQYLHNGWRVCDQSLPQPIPATVPGCFTRDLINFGTVKDIFYRDNAQKYRWIEDCNPVYVLSFSAKAHPNARITFEGLDTFARIYLNGTLLGETHNMFIPHSFDVSEQLLDGENELRVEFTSPIRAVEGQPVAPGFAFTGDRVRARRMQCTYGWDWVDRFVTMGIYRPVYIEYIDSITLRDVYIHTDCVDKLGASLSIDHTFENIGDGEIAELEIIYCGTVIHKDRFLADRPFIRRHVDIEKPSLWYPNGYGDVALYNYRLTVGGSAYEERFGIRTLRIERLRDKPGSPYYEKALAASRTEAGGVYGRDDGFFGFSCIVNGERIFLRGANWVPSEPFPSDESDEKIYSLIEKYREMGANVLRVWGGGLFEKRALYDACDRAGILVIHDFLMACASYPEDEAWFINELRLESEYAVRLLRNHPSLAWFHGDNENAVLGSDTSRAYIGKNSAHLGSFPSVYENSKGVEILESSPWGGNSYGSITSGTSHNTNYLGSIFGHFDNTDCSDYKEYLSGFTSRFVSEEPTFGAICRESMLEFMSEEDLLGDDESILLYHTKTNPFLKKEIYGYVRGFAEKVLGKFEDPEDRFFKLKYIQAEWMRVTLELSLSNVGYTNGAVYWMFNDCWPAALGWSLVDYYGRPKAAYYAFKRASIPTVGSLTNGGRTLRLSNVAGWYETARMRIYRLERKGGFAHEEVFRKDTHVSEYSSFEIETGLSDVGDDIYILDTKNRYGTYRTFCKNGALHIKPTVAFELLFSDSESVTVRAHSYIHSLELEGDADFSDNYFIMLEGEERRIEILRRGEKFNGVKINAYTIK